MIVSIKRKSILFLAVAFFGFLFFLPTEVFAATYYVNGTGGSYTSVTYPTAGATWGIGNDTTGNGSQATPWATFRKAFGNLVNKGDTIYIAGGAGTVYTETSTHMAITFKAGSGTTSIIGDGEVNFNMYTPVVAYIFYFYTNADDVIWDNINITNTTPINSKTVFRMSGGNYTFKNSTFDFNNATGNVSMWNTIASVSAAHVNIQSSKVINHPTFVFQNQNTSTGSYVKFESDFFSNNDKLVWLNSAAMDSYIHNCTIASFIHGFYFPQVTGSYLEFTNNIFLSDPNTPLPFLRFDSDTVEDWYVVNSSSLVVTNNIFGPTNNHTLKEFTYGTDAGTVFASGDNYDNSSGIGEATAKFLNNKNWMFEMSFTDPTSSIYSLSSSADLANGRGDSTYLPTYDINGNAWSGNHIGAWPNPTTVTPSLSINSNSVSVVGDSVAYGTEVDNSCPCANLTDSEGPACWFDYYDGGCSAGTTVYSSTGTTFIGTGNPHPFDDVFDVMPGMRIQGLYFWVDQIMANYAPSTVFVYVGTNNLINSSIYPGESSTTDLANLILTTMQKIEDWGATPVWLGPTGNSENQARIREIDSLVAAGCQTNGWKYDSVFDRIQNFNATSTPYYVSQSAVHHNALGAKFVGSVMENLYNNRSNYYVANSSIDSIIAGTFLHPFAVTDFNSATSVPTGEVGRTIMATGTLTTTLNTPSAGSSGKVLTLKGGNWNAGIVIDQNYWLLENLLISGSNASNRGLTVSGSNVTIQNITINSSTDVGIYVTESCTIKNTVVANSVGNDIEIADTKTVTGYNNFFQDVINAGLGIYTDAGGTIWSGGDPYFVDPSSPNFYLRAHSPLIDAGITISGRTNDFTSTTLYGTPDIGAYEFQPTEVVGVNYINTSANVRIYTDGKFRNTSATSTSATNNFSVTPLGGSFSSGSNVWLDISFTNWQTTSTQNKTFTASSTVATTTIFTIGDLVANKYYTIKLDGAVTSTITGSGCSSSVCLSSGSGVITFTYSGGYSTHEFTIEQDVTSPSAFTLSSPVNSATTTDQTPTFTWNASADSESGLAEYQLFIDDVLDIDNIASTTLSTTTASTLSYGAHTWYVKAIDNNGAGTTSTATFTLTVVDEVAPSAFTLSLPANNTSDSNKTPSLTWNASSDSGVGLSSYVVYVDSVLNTSGISSSTTSYTLTSDLSCGAHTWYVKAMDVSSNETNSDIFNYTVTCSTGGSSPVVPAPSSPTVASPATISLVVVPNTPQTISIGNTSHTVTVSTPSANGQVTVTIQSDPITITLKPGEEQLVDTNKDNKDDIFIRYDSLDGDKIKLTLSAIEDLEFSINQALSTTNNQQVTLYFNSPDATLVAISNSSNFTNTSFETYTKTKPWTLTPGNGIKTVYVKFRTDKGGTRDVSDTITLTSQATDQVILTDNCPLTPEQSYKSIQSNSVYYITTDCTKRAFSQSTVFFTYFTSWNDVKTTTKENLDIIPNDTLGFMPWGPNYDPKYGALVKIVTDPKVYLLLNTEKYWITSELVFNALKYAWNWIEDIDARLLNKYTTGSEITDTQHHPNYTLIKYQNDAKVYRLEPDSEGVQTKRWITDEKTFNSLNFRWDRIVTINDTEVYEDGEKLEY